MADPFTAITAASAGASLIGTVAGMGGSAASAGLGVAAAQQEGEARAQQAQLQGEAGVLKARADALSATAKTEGFEAEGRAWQYKAGIADLNKSIAKQNADYARWTGDVEAQESGLRTRAQVGETRAKQAGSGLDVNFGSAVATRGSETALGQFDQSVIRSNAAKRAYGYDVEAVGHEAEAGLARMAADTSKTAAGYARKGLDFAAAEEDLAKRGAELGVTSAKQAADIKVQQSIIGGATSVASKWTQGSSTFPWSSGSSNPTGYDVNPWSAGGILGGAA